MLISVPIQQVKSTSIFRFVQLVIILQQLNEYSPKVAKHEFFRSPIRP